MVLSRSGLAGAFRTASPTMSPLIRRLSHGCPLMKLQIGRARVSTKSSSLLRKPSRLVSRSGAATICSFEGGTSVTANVSVVAGEKPCASSRRCATLLVPERPPER